MCRGGGIDIAMCVCMSLYIDTGMCVGGGGGKRRLCDSHQRRIEWNERSSSSFVVDLLRTYPPSSNISHGLHMDYTTNLCVWGGYMYQFINYPTLQNVWNTISLPWQQNILYHCQSTWTPRGRQCTRQDQSTGLVALTTIAVSKDSYINR